ncbi:FAD-dependent 5-carboxymethylaminomethyl-2-thiouridine(34) oxidoreductase MnmC [Ottowia sp.]|uniref:FAD-dependent 5-carboxymethylaminomethyl-2-thiouridine(34) oxidoreductase MnmC n=1 Tax=Ottowia sp. TaxID=1898956 RepID=UPI003A8C2987
MPQSTLPWRADGPPFSPHFDDVHHNAGADGPGGWTQAREVFLRGCGLLPERAGDGDNNGGAPTVWAGQPVWQVLENGFGLGLNFLATWHAWAADPQRPARLFYSAVEACLPEAADMLRSAAPYPELQPLAAQLAAQWRGLLPGLHRLQFEGGALQLTLAVGDARPMLAELSGRFDSLYLDGFSPPENPDMWSAEVLRAATRLLRPGARAATWCVAAEVRQRLTACGFDVQRVPDPPPQHKALHATYTPRYTPRRRTQAGDIMPWQEPPGRCTIVGAGLACASLAYSLAARGWQVTVLGQSDAPADGASHLPAGIVAPHISPDDRPLSRLTRAGCAATLARARALLQSGVDFAETGVLERHAPGERRRPALWIDAEDAAPSTVSRATSTSASAWLLAQAGLPVAADQPALWHAAAGWIKPAALVRAMLAAPGVRFVGSAPVARVVPHGRIWQVLNADNALLAEADLVVLAAGFDTLGLLQASFSEVAHAPPPDLPPAAWPLHALRGQVAFGPMPDDARAQAALPPFPVNGHGSLIAPVPDGGSAFWITGSTFERANPQPELHAADHAANRQRLAELLPQAAAALSPQWNDGRAQSWAAVRCTVPDRLPMLGPLRWPPLLEVENTASNQPLSLNTQAQTAIKSKAKFTAAAPSIPAPQPPWVFTGLGARGLTLAVLCGEIAAAWLMNEPLPVAQSLARSLRAARFSSGT